MDSEYRLLDTNVVSYIFSSKPERERFVPHLKGRIGAVSFVTIGELVCGAVQGNWSDIKRSEMEQNIRDNYVVVPYSADVARTWGELVAACRKSGFTPGENDAWIAATAIVFDCPLVTNDEGFQQMKRHYPGLIVLS